ncbi:hypothetical protein [Ammoniphilus sp. CFH 90114]|uniref:hypothetical protein n=1 Tax=Ammoniphilus sp. CFH 90114 TaxID=2493665 RepID=UPI00100F46F8|nr:hypothetical protein [Ammoniphilus sp. CFH 90114]RXT03934.1 hypothetical protein EIZ39_22525 [Ammoniphilus sp. CFH 90114]
MKRIMILLIFLTILAGCSLSNNDKIMDQFMGKAPYAESIVVLHKEELDRGIMMLFKDESGFRHALFSRKLGYWNMSGNAELNPKDGFTWTMSNDPNIPIVTFAGIVTNDEIKKVMVRQETLSEQAKIIETEQGRVWFTYFDTLENADPAPLKIEALSDRGQILWKEGIYDGKLFRGETENVRW